MNDYTDNFGRCESGGELVEETRLVSIEIGGEEFLICQTHLDEHVSREKIVIL